MKQKFNVTGMTCSACQGHVHDSVTKLVGVDEVDVNLLTNTMTVEYDDKLVQVSTIEEAVKNAGYKADLAGDNAKQAFDDARDKKRNLIYSFIFLGLLMYVSMSSMFAYPIFSFIKEEPRINVILQIFFLIPILWLQRKYFINGFKMLIKLNPTMDSLIALGAGAAILYSIYSTIMIFSDALHASHMMHTIYYESAGMIVTLISFGKYLEYRAKQKTTDAISKLMDLAPKHATVLRDGNEVLVKIEELQLGDQVLVKADETIPVDGIVLQGQTSVNEAMITGESLPVEKEVNSKVIGGTHNLQGTFQFEVTSTVENSTLAKIIALVEEASSSKAPITSVVDKVVKWFVPTVIAISVITFITWLALGESFAFALSNAIAVLVISCPCALGLATPVAIMVSTGVGAKNGILLKSASVLENERNVDVVVLDKTGTITKGQASVSDISSHVYSDKEIMQIVASLEKGSSHVLANAIVEKANSFDIMYQEITDFASLSGYGLQGTIGDTTYMVGNMRLMEKEKIDTSKYIDQYNQLVKAGKTCVFIACKKEVVGLLGIYDEIKETSKEAIQELKKMGIQVMMLTGDSKKAANALNETLHLDKVIAEVLPEDKEKEIRLLQEQGHHVLMVGDGINDAPALVRSDVGLAIGAGNDIAIDSADVILMKDDLRDIITSIRLSKKTVRNIKENLFWAFFYNCIGIPIAAGVFYYSNGWRLDAMIGALCMSLSSVCVVANALRLRNFKVKHTKEIRKMKKVMDIDGMMCEHCKGRVEGALNALQETKATVDLENHRAVVETALDDDILKSAVENAGYVVKDIKHDE